MNGVLQVQETTINTRRRAEEIVTEARERDCTTIDLQNVEFISRSVADELVHQVESTDVELVGLSGDVKIMYEVVAGPGSLAAQ